MINIINKINIFYKLAVDSTLESPPSAPIKLERHLEIENPYIAQEDWLAEALRNVFQATDDEIYQFIYRFYSTISDLRFSFNKRPDLIGRGKDGVAFDIGGEKILKIFSNQFAYQKAKQSMTLLHSGKSKARTEAMIYDAGILGEMAGGKNVYFTITEKMIPVEENPVASLYLKRLLTIIKDAITSTPIMDRINWLRNNKTKSHKQIKLISQEILSFIKETNGKGEIDNINSLIIEELGVRKDWLEKYIEEIVIKIISSRFDLHLGNVGATASGWIRYFDSAYLSGGSGKIRTDESLAKKAPITQVALE